jgi:phosphoglycolate phosphatase
MLKLLVFDWDGTLANSLESIFLCKTYLAKKYNLPLPTETLVREALGKKFDDALKLCFPNTAQNTLKKVGKEFHALMQQPEYQAPLFPDVKPMLYDVKKQGLKLAIATSKHRQELDSALLYHDLFHIFDMTCCGREYKEKPDALMLRHMMDTFCVQPAETLMIGDTTTDILFATQANVQTIGVTFGAHSPVRLMSLHPIALIETWKQLPEVIKKLC